MDTNASFPPDVVSPAQAAATLRSLIKLLTEAQSPPVVIGEDGVPQAVLLAYRDFERLLEAAGEVDAAMIADRLSTTPQRGEGLSNDGLERLVMEMGREDDM
ncbi:hypothetical protein ACFVYP_27375 [Kitasatospora sp. NPDC058201]|uniref:hypothetical protein n=1 Tax=unclassified Kitasatospora TaxID=2633591 RepID=UPI00365225C7